MSLHTPLGELHFSFYGSIPPPRPSFQPSLSFTHSFAPSRFQPASHHNLSWLTRHNRLQFTFFAIAFFLLQAFSNLHSCSNSCSCSETKYHALGTLSIRVGAKSQKSLGLTKSLGSPNLVPKILRRDYPTACHPMVSPNGHLWPILGGSFPHLRLVSDSKFWL